MKIIIYVKMDTPEPLLLCEGVLGIVTYHPDVLATSRKRSSLVSNTNGAGEIDMWCEAST